MRKITIEKLAVPAARAYDDDELVREAILASEEVQASFGWTSAQRLLATIDALRAAIPTWQPIETAPKTGAVILVWPTRAGLDVARWSSEANAFITPDTHAVCPTRWMPLPAPPEVKA